MENEIPMSQPPLPQPEFQPQETANPRQFDIEAMKAQARELAIQQVLASRVATASQQQAQPTNQQVIYVRRNLTVAELIVVFIIACGITTGIPATWKFAANYLPHIEIKVR